MKRSQAVSGYQIARQSIALALSAFLIPFASGNLYAQGGYAPLDAPGLDQLVAPIALYPDSLVAQILTAATFPEQVREADDWTRQNAGLRPQQRADLANGMPWDPSVKALTAFPTVLNSLARNPNWTASLGNAYYNQPGDVMNAVQAMRVQAQQGGYLRSTPQQRVYYDGGQILIAPVNPELVYVPYYDPWRIYGEGYLRHTRVTIWRRDLPDGPWGSELDSPWAFQLGCLPTTAGVITVGRPTGAVAVFTITTLTTFRAARRSTITATLAATTVAYSSTRDGAFRRTSILA